MRTRRWLAAGFGVLISVIFLQIAFQNLNLAAVWQDVQEAQVGWLLLGAGIYFVAVSLISWRWQFLLRAVQLVSLRHLIPLVAIGYMGNNVYPFRTGEVLRIALLRRNHGIPLTKATTTVIVERVFDGLVMLTFIIVSLQFVPIESREIQTVATFSAPIFLVALAIFFALAARPDLLRQLREKVSRFLPEKLRKPVSHLIEDVLSGLEGLRSPADLAGAVIASFLSWGVEASVYWLVSFAFNLNMGYPVLLLVVGVVNLAGLLPASPGQIGVFEFFVGVVLTAVGIPGEQAKAFALVVHVVIWLPVTVVGFYFLVRQGLGWSAITRAKEFEQQAAR
ncbi:MAG: flippase-like domain-containing protein [Anaerolineaceae bacterium]|nr:flippase-like domain-containing protein [Anaerolineaceae bacterium]